MTTKWGIFIENSPLRSAPLSWLRSERRDALARLTFAVKWDLVGEVGEGGYIEYPPSLSFPDPIRPLFFVLTPLSFN
jgi:hypothetical protein